MMAVWGAAGALLLVLLTGGSYSYPVKQGFDPSSSYSYDANPVSADWGAPSSGGFAPAAPGSGAASKMVQKSPRPQTAPRREPSYPQPSGRREPVASNALAAPEHSGYASSSPSSHFQPTATKEFAWAVAPQSLFSRGETSTRSSARRPASSRLAPEPLGHSNEKSPPGRLVPEIQAGELSKVEKSYEHGNYESETEEQGFQPPPPPPVKDLDGEDSGRLQPSGPGRKRANYFYPNPYDYMFLTGQYPRGTLTHYSSTYELGTDHWQDSHYVRDYFPAAPSVQEVESFPADFGAPQHFSQASLAAQPNTGSTNVDLSGAGGQNQPYEGAGLGYYSQPGQPHQGSRPGGNNWRKVGY